MKPALVQSLLLLFLFLLCVPSIHGRVRKAAIFIRVPKRGPFLKAEDDQSYIEPLSHKLSEEETQEYIVLGRKLREIYIRSHRLLPSHFDPLSLQIQSSGSTRVTQSAQAIGLGLYQSEDASSVGDLIPITVFSDRCAVTTTTLAKVDLSEDMLSATRQLMNRYQVVRGNEREVAEWIFESSLLTLEDNNKETFPFTTTTIATAEGGSSVVRDIFSDFFARPHEEAVKIFVLDNDDEQIMRNVLLLGSERTTRMLIPPRVVFCELHDNDEVFEPAESSSPHLFVRLIHDFVPQVCNGDTQEEFCAVVDVYTKLMDCDDSSVLGNGKKDAELLLSSSSSLENDFPPQSSSSSNNNEPCPGGAEGVAKREEIQDDFFFGVVTGCALMALAMAFCPWCEGNSAQHQEEINMLRKKLGEEEEEGRNHHHGMDHPTQANTVEQQQQPAHEQQQQQQSIQVLPSSTLPSKPRRVHVIPHIPRPVIHTTKHDYMV